MKKHLAILFLVLMLPFCAQAQDPMEISGNIELYNKQSKKIITSPEALFYTIFPSQEVAENARKRIEQVRAMNITDFEKEDRINAIRKELNIVGKTSAKGRAFQEVAPAGTALLFVVAQPDFETAVVVIREGVTEYKNVRIEVQRIDEVDVTSKVKAGQKIGGGIVSDADDGYEYFQVNLELLADVARDDARMILQTYAVDCQTEDTVDYCRPVVVEGDWYHGLQNKRMGYDFMKNDKLAFAYDSTLHFTGDSTFSYHDRIKWKKKDTKRTYQGPFRLTVEDYTHVYLDTLIEGTCLRRRPFKFLDFTPALAQVALTEEFRDDSKSKYEKKNQDLNLRFEVGTDVLTADSMNTVERDNLIEELSSYGDQLMSPTIIGSASPDGSRATNEALARKRALKAQAMISPYLPRHAQPKVSTVVHTWNEVVDVLKRTGHQEEADAMEAILQGGGNNEGALTGAMKGIANYAEVIEPVLQSMRTMKCAYQVMRQHVLTPRECVEEFHKFKEDYMSGKKHFSSGDYYNLFNMITDSVELDELTIMGYREVTHMPDYDVEVRMAPYICNRMELMNLRRGKPNSSILAPFIDYSRQTLNAWRGIDATLRVKMNRREIVTNQAVTFYQEQKIDSAMYLIGLLEKGNVKDPNVEMLKTLIDLKTLHFTDPGSDRYRAAKSRVLNASNDNKAILYTEIDEWGMQKEAQIYVDRMDDRNPKKWYLKALLAAERLDYGKKTDPELISRGKAASSSNSGGGGECYPRVEEAEEGMLNFDMGEDYFKGYMAAKQKYMDTHDGKLPAVGECLGESAAPTPAQETKKTEDENISVEGIAHYLGYMQHCFDLDKSYFKYFLAEGSIPEVLRKKYPWKRTRRPAYRKLFELLQENDAAQADAAKAAARAAATKAAAEKDDEAKEEKPAESADKKEQE